MLLISTKTQSAVAYGADALTWQGVPSGGALSSSYTVNAAPYQALVVVVRGNWSGFSATSITYGGEPMTLVQSASTASVFLQAWILTLPPSGANTLSVNTTYGSEIAVTAFTYSGVHPFSPTGAAGGATLAADPDPWTLDVNLTPTDPNSTVVQAMAVNGYNWTGPTGHSVSLGSSIHYDNPTINSSNQTPLGIGEWSPGSTSPLTLSQTITESCSGCYMDQVALAFELIPVPDWSPTPTATNTPNYTPTPTSTITVTPTITPTPCGCVPVSATLDYAGDDNVDFWLNGVHLAGCTACWSWISTHNLTAGQLGAFDGCGCNVLSAYGTDTGAFVSGMTWRLSITYSDPSSCPSEVLTSDGQSTRVSYAGNANTGLPPVSFPSGWQDPAFDDSTWWAPYTSFSLPSGRGWASIAGIPWLWGVNNFTVPNAAGGDGYLVRQRFALGNSSCDLPVIATPTPYAGTPTVTNTPTISATPTVTPSPTATPLMPLQKSASAASVTLGDTLTFYINWSNDSAAPVNMVIWDTVHAALTFQGCSGAACSQSGGLVTWTPGLVPPGSTGQVAFWATVSSYP